MKVSTKGRYALRIMLDLAQHDEGEFIPVKDISQRQDISIKYIEQIITMLNRAGFVKSVRGNRGGYMLSRQPKDYTVGMILRVAEGSLSPVSCLDDDPNQCPRCKVCPTLSLWTRLNNAINSVVDTTTLQDIIEEAQNFTEHNYII
jgi:Rrf2 family protein